LQSRGHDALVVQLADQKMSEAVASCTHCRMTER
jgi:hypothetical protein